MKRLTVTSLTLSLLLPALPAFGADNIQSRPVTLAPDSHAATLKGTLHGDRIVDYTLAARAGQTLSVTLKTDNTANYFNVLPPGSNDVALFIGSVGGEAWSGRLDADGIYTVRVYLMRSAARRHETAHYSLRLGIAD